jgi:hypothetical protein
MHEFTTIDKPRNFVLYSHNTSYYYLNIFYILGDFYFDMQFWVIQTSPHDSLIFVEPTTSLYSHPQWPMYSSKVPTHLHHITTIIINIFFLLSPSPFSSSSLCSTELCCGLWFYSLPNDSEQKGTIHYTAH